ncbi:MAG: hypothetical protein ACYS15_02995 [Planctomycetota bacterium]
MRSNRTSLLSHFVVLAFGLPVHGAAAAAHADEIESFWIPASGDFGDPANWNGPVPDETVTAIFEVDFDPDLGPFVEFNDDHVSHRAIVRAGEALFLMWDTVDGEDISRTYQLMSPTVDAPSLVVGENPADDAALTIFAGLLDTRSTVIGRLGGSAGTTEFATIFDLFTGLSCEAHLYVGDGGQGLLDISNNATVTCGSCVLGAQTGSAGEIDVMGQPASLTSGGILTVGAAGQGILTIGDAATVTSGSAVVAAGSASTGDVTVSGQNSSWALAGTMSVGQGGNGSVTVSDDAELASGSVIIGQQFDAIGDATVTGIGSTWTINGSLDVGYFGNGNLTICDGGAVFVYGGFVTLGTWPDLENENGGVGNVTVCGPGSFWFVDGDLYVGFLWLGTLNVEGGATVLSQNGIVGANYDPEIWATVQGPGSIWSNSGPLTVYSILSVTDGGMVVADSVGIDSSAELTGDGTIQGFTSSGGVVRVGDPVGALVVDGGLSTSGELMIDLAGANPGGFDVLSVIGNAQLGGTLTVTLLDGYAPQGGETFEIIVADSVNGAFGSMTLPSLPPPLTWDFIQDADSVELHVSLPGDLDGDGVVGINDFLLLLAAWGPCPEPCPPSCPADLDGDCVVSINDFLLMLAYWTV